LRFSDDTLAACVDILSGLRLIDLAVTTVAVAFQVLRSEALKQGEGQYFTPQPVIQAGVRLLDIRLDDLVIDPACGTGGFLVETMLHMGSRFAGMTQADLTRWAQTHLFGIEKDAIGIKLAKAIMQIAGDGSAHCARGDSVRTVKWSSDFPHLASGTFANGRFTVVVTNPPFGKNLKVSAKDARLSSLDIAKAGRENYRDLEIGFMFLQRAYDLLADNGRIGIVLPETYFFSPNYLFLQEWLRTRLRPVAVANIPMEAFQGFCRAKTNFYVFQKIPEGAVVDDTEMVTFLNPRTCGIYKNGSVRYVTDPVTGKRTDQVDNELMEAVTDYGQRRDACDTYGLTRVPLREVFSRQVIVPTYYDRRYDAGIYALLAAEGVSGVTLGELVESGILRIRGGHGSPGNDQRSGHIPYVKVSDIRALRVNVNPTNLVSLPIARKYWRGDVSGLGAWDLITPNRASSNIGEFAILLPGEEQVVLTKEMFVIRVAEHPVLDPFFMLWAFSLQAVREQWRRIALMQTNREDCGKRHLEVVIPMPPTRQWASERCGAFRDYFTAVAAARGTFRDQVANDDYGYIANVCADEVDEYDSEDSE
jgi:type I restriction enzyme M protein